MFGCLIKLVFWDYALLFDKDCTNAGHLFFKGFEGTLNVVLFCLTQ